MIKNILKKKEIIERFTKLNFPANFVTYTFFTYTFDYLLSDDLYTYLNKLLPSNMKSKIRTI